VTQAKSLDKSSQLQVKTSLLGLEVEMDWPVSKDETS